MRARSSHHTSGCARLSVRGARLLALGIALSLAAGCSRSAGPSSSTAARLARRSRQAPRCGGLGGSAIARQQHRGVACLSDHGGGDQAEALRGPVESGHRRHRQGGRAALAARDQPRRLDLHVRLGRACAREAEARQHPVGVGPRSAQGRQRRDLRRRDPRAHEPGEAHRGHAQRAHRIRSTGEAAELLPAAQGGDSGVRNRAPWRAPHPA